LPRWCELAWWQGKAFSLSQDWERSNKVVIAGMGGSAIAGDLVADLASLQATIPIWVVRDFQFPFALDEHSLVIVCSYSGNTTETLSLFHQAIKAGARVMAVTGGGLLAEEVERHRVPRLNIPVRGEPRSAVGYTLLLLLGSLHCLGVVETGEDDVRAATEALGQQVVQLSEEVPTRDNPAKQLAVELRGKLIQIYGGGIFSGMARRWKTQLNENAKVWAFFETIPELLHNSIEAYRSLPDISERTMVLLLQPNPGADQLGDRCRVVAQLLQQSGISYRVLEGGGGRPLEQLLGMLLLGDYVSYYLALLNGVDPSATPAIAWSKTL
jgi:glucose/mannose-6-phosphate isomerase